MNPTITIHNTDPVDSTDEHNWIGGRIPFLYWSDANHLDVGTQGTHHGSIYRALGSEEWGEPHHGMIFVNQTAAQNAHPSGRNMLWWSGDPPAEVHQGVENVMREHFPQMNWDGGRSWSKWDDEFDWEDSEPSHTLGHTLGSNGVQIIDVPGKVPAMRHSDDMPYLYHVPSRQLYVGPRGAYHEDLDKAHPGVGAYFNWAEEGVNVDDYGRVIPDEHTYDWLRGRVDNPSHGNSHYDADAAYNPDAFKMLKPHWQAIDEAIGAPPQFIDYDWHTSAVEPGSDQVEYVPGKYHKGVLTANNTLHIWPLMSEHIDGHPYHDEYAQGWNAYLQMKGADYEHQIDREDGYLGDTRFYIHPDPYAVNYADGENLTNTYFVGHDNDTLQQRLNQHIPGIKVLDNHEFRRTSDGLAGWESSTHALPHALGSHTLPSGEVHIALDVPERIRLQIARWVESLDLPTYALVDPLTYHITVAYAKEGVEYLTPSRVKNNFNMTGLKFDTHALSEFEGGALVLELENEYFTEWATKLVEYLEGEGIDCERYPGGPKPHITLAYDVEKPSHTLPPISFRCGPLSISTPRDASQVGLGPYTAVRTASAPATPPPWTPGNWGKGLFFDLPDGPQMSAWNTYTESLNGGKPHHNQVSEGIHGIPWGDMIDMIKAKQCYLLKVQPDGVAYECAMGHALPPSFDAIAQEHGLQRHPADNQEYAENDWS